MPLQTKGSLESVVNLAVTGACGAVVIAWLQSLPHRSAPLGPRTCMILRKKQVLAPL